MTKKDYVIIATAIAQATREINPAMSARTAVDSIIEHVSHALQVDNPNFKPETFRAYIAKMTRS